jgi:sec-independent protein translocase protein TatA
VPPLGGMELLIILAIILLFFGAARVPQLGRSLGKSMREFRKAASEDSDNELEGETKERGEIPQTEEDPATKEARSSH